MQAQNRMTELQQKLAYAVRTARDTKYELLDAEKEHTKAIEKHRAAKAALDEINEVIRLLAEGDDGLFPWGLPRTIRIEHFKRLVPSADIPDTDIELETAAFQRAESQTKGS